MTGSFPVCGVIHRGGPRHVDVHSMFKFPSGQPQPPSGESRATLQMTARGVAATANGAMAQWWDLGLPTPCLLSSLGAKPKNKAPAGLSSASRPLRSDSAGSPAGQDDGSLPPHSHPNDGVLSSPVSRRVTRSMSRGSVSSLDSASADVDAVLVTEPEALVSASLTRNIDSEGFVIPPSPAIPASRSRGSRRRPTRTSSDSASDSGTTASSAISQPRSPVVQMCPECARTFPSKSGLSQHRKHAHRMEYEADVNIARKKARWSAEEIRLLAMKEAELVRAGAKNLNERLQEFLPDRSFDSIKSRRRHPDFKRQVEEFLSSPPSAGSVELVAPLRVTSCLSSELITPFQDLFATISSSLSPTYAENKLNEIWRNIELLTPSELMDNLSLYLRETFPSRPAVSRDSSRSRVVSQVSRRQERHRNYKRTQYFYKKNRSRCIQNILSPTSVSDALTASEVFVFWENLLKDSPPQVDAIEDYFLVEPVPIVSELWSPISLEEVKAIKFSRSSAPGPDGLQAEDYNSIPTTVLVKLFNLFLVLGEVPKSLWSSRTIFIPKTENASSPADFRPISVSSFLLRSFHKILARRLTSLVPIDKRQRGFISEDGCAQNIFLLETIIRHQREELKDLFLGCMDLHKAFDSVSHEAIFAAAAAHGVPPQFVSYLRTMYQHASISLSFDRTVSTEFVPARGVRQGDPLSPVLFNLVMDRLLSTLPSVGVDVATVRIPALVYADDLILLSSSKKGLQLQLDHLGGFLSHCGMQANIYKSFTMTLRASGKDKKIVTDPRCVFRLGSHDLRTLTAIDTFKYLGVTFSPTGRVKTSKTDLSALLLKLQKAPFKPQQRLFALAHFVIPKYSHCLTLGRVYIGFLKQLDKVVRQFVRRWCDLPHDCPVAYFHADVNDGGLGIPSFRWSIPLMKMRRLTNMRDIYLNADNSYVKKELAYAKRFLQDGAQRINSKAQLSLLWRKKLYTSVDGVDLKCSGKTKGQNVWVGDGTTFLQSKDFINALKLRINALPVRSRTSRGRQVDRQCRAGCLRPETLNHVLQDCHRTHGARVKRHDNLVDYLQTSLTARDFVVVREARYHTDEGIRKPDIIAVKDQELFVLDAQVTGTSDLNAANRLKINKYKNNRSLHQRLIERFNTTNITYLALTVSNRGIWAPDSISELLKRGILRKKDIKIYSTRAIIGGIAAFRAFSRMTATQRRR